MIKMGDEGLVNSSSAKIRLEDMIIEIQQTIKNISLAHNELWYTIFSSEDNSKDYCKFRNALDPIVKNIQIETY
jgi:hypothetical protein